MLIPIFNLWGFGVFASDDFAVDATMTGNLHIGFA
jgi:hypothetical protein